MLYCERHGYINFRTQRFLVLLRLLYCVNSIDPSHRIDLATQTLHPGQSAAPVELPTPQQLVAARVDTPSAAVQTVQVDQTSVLPLDQYSCLSPDILDILLGSTRQQLSISSANLASIGQHDRADRGSVDSFPSCANNQSVDAAANAPVLEPAWQGPEEVDPIDVHNWVAAGGKVLAASQEAKRPHMVLDGNEDTFMRIAVKHNMWIILELPHIVKPSLIQIVQTELYSARLNAFLVHGRQSHPRVDLPPGQGRAPEYNCTLNSTAWQLIGEYGAAKRMGTQSFKVRSDAPWIKFILLQVRTVHGSEPNFAVNEIGVAGKSAAEDLEDQLAIGARDPQLAPSGGQATTAGNNQTIEPDELRDIDLNGQASSSSSSGSDLLSDNVSSATRALPLQDLPQATATIPVDTRQRLKAADPSRPPEQPDYRSNVQNERPFQPQEAPVGSQVPSTEQPSATVTVVGRSLTDKGVLYGDSKSSTLALQTGSSSESPTASGETFSTNNPASAPPVLQGATPNSSKPAADGQTSSSTASSMSAANPKGCDQTIPSAEAVAAAAAGEPFGDSRVLPSSRTGHSVYDTLIHEIKMLKLQAHKLPRDLSDLRRDMSGDNVRLARRTAAMLARLEKVERQPALVEALAAVTAGQLTQLLGRVELLETQHRASRTRETAIVAAGAVVFAAMLPHLLHKHGFLVRVVQTAIVLGAIVNVVFSFTQFAPLVQIETVTKSSRLQMRQLQNSGATESKTIVI